MSSPRIFGERGLPPDHVLPACYRGVHHGVSEQWLQGYLNEYAWRYNRRGPRNTMFRDLLDAAASDTL